MKKTILTFATFVLFASTSFSDVNQDSLQQAIETVGSVKNEIKTAGRIFGVNPEFIAGAIIAEHALNVNWVDDWQNRAVRNEWTRRLLTRPSNSRLVEFLRSENIVENCSGIPRAYNFWYCVMRRRYALSAIIPTNGTYRRFTNEYFNPNNIGTTFGLGQLSPLRALMVTDIVANRTNIPEIDFTSESSRSQLYSDLLNPSRVVYYIAATMSQAIEIYGAYGFNVSNDMGVVVTLYNIGNEAFHANNRRREGGEPSPNNMGRWAEANIAIIRNSIR